LRRATVISKKRFELAGKLRKHFLGRLDKPLFTAGLLNKKGEDLSHHEKFPQKGVC